MSNLSPIETMSKRFFGRKHALTVWQHIMGYPVEPPVSFTALQLQDELKTEKEVHRTATFDEVKLLRELGMIAVVETEVDRSIPYHRVDSPIWDLVPHLVALVQESPDSPDNE